MRLFLLTLCLVMSTVVSANAFTRWFDDKTNTEVIELQPGESATEELHCLALNIYWEARNQSRVGMIAVARVVMNRVKDNRFPDTICKVVYDGPISKWWLEEKGKEVPVRHKCQFSWYCDGKSDEVPEQDLGYTWRIAQEIAWDIIYDDRWAGVIDGATHYHANYVKPHWRKSLHYVGRVDDHLFYRWD